LIHSIATVTIRDLRTKFPKVRGLVETDGQVIVTEHGQPRFLLQPYRAKSLRKMPAVNFYKRLVTRMPKMLSEAQSRAIDELNRGER
jgi:antitoxin (DNA-binding transcriptional repressor) of toxin-antitoxin stability system